MFVAHDILFITLALRGGVMVYYFKYYVGREDMFSLFNVIGTGTTIIGVLLSKPVAERIGKRRLFILGLLGTVLFTALFILLPPRNLPLIIAIEMLRQFAYGFTIPLLWAMMADVADFSEWKNSPPRHRRDLLGHHLRPQGRTGDRRRDRRLRPRRVRLRAERRCSRSTRCSASVSRRASIRRSDSSCAPSAWCSTASTSRSSSRCRTSSRERREAFDAHPSSRPHHDHDDTDSPRVRPCSSSPARPAHGVGTSTAASTTRGSRGRFAESFMVGAALAPQQFTERDTASASLIRREFNTITPENVLKWERVHPQPDRYDFAPTDRYVAFGERNGMFIVGHTLVWHSQTPRWVFQNAQGQPLTRDALLARMKDHISHRRRALQGTDQGVGRGERSVERGRHAAPVAAGIASSATTTSRRRSSSRARPTPPRSSTTTTTTWTIRRSATAPSG